MATEYIYTKKSLNEEKPDKALKNGHICLRTNPGMAFIYCVQVFGFTNVPSSQASGLPASSPSMSITSRQYIENEAWLLFQLNDEPVRTISDGDFNVLAIMDVATGLIHGMEFFDIDTEEPTEFESKKLLNSSESNAGMLPKFIFVNSSQRLVRFARAVSSMGIKIIPEEKKNLDPFTEEARVGFATHAKRGSMH